MSKEKVATLPNIMLHNAQNMETLYATSHCDVLGFINFGGPAGQIAIIHKELVDKIRWIFTFFPYSIENTIKPDYKSL